MAKDADAWMTKESLAESRHAHSCVSMNSNIYVIGGSQKELRFSSDLLSTEIFSLQSETWSSGPKLPAPVTNGQAFTYNDTVYALSTAGLAFALVDGTWKTIIPISKKNRNVFPAVIVNKKIIGC